MARLSDGERARVQRLAISSSRLLGIPFRALPNAYLRVLYALAVAGEPLSPNEITALMALRWDSHSDPSSVQRRLALGAQQGEIRTASGGCYGLTSGGWQKLRELEERWLGDTPGRRGSAPASRSPRGMGKGPTRQRPRRRPDVG